MSDNIAISIIIPLYRAEKFIRECIDSVLQQSFTESYEVIVIDDCSDDRSAEIVSELVDAHADKIRLIRHEHNRGVSAARNTGLGEIRGEYFMFVDADDRLPQGALAQFYEAAKV